MNREALIEYAYDPYEHLNLGNETYKQWVFRYTFLELEKDLSVRGDISTALFDDFDKVVRAQIIARDNGIVAGLDEIRYFLCDADVHFRPRLKERFDLVMHFQDGDGVMKGDVLVEIKAKASAILAAERVILNFLARMSGVATNAAKLSYEAHKFGVKIAGTRKTLWGMLDKRALHLGGALPHRFNLGDSVIAKDTHMDLIGRNFEVFFKRLAKDVPECRFIEVEVLNKDEALRVAKLFCEADLRSVGIVMLDNMSSVDISSTLEGVKAAGHYETVLFEASGGISSINLEEYAKTGIDVLSMGSLTNGVDSLDLSLKMV